MAEAEDVLTDAARHATEYAQALWQRHRPKDGRPSPLRLQDVARRLDLLLSASFGRSFALRPAQADLPPNWLARCLRRDLLPWQPQPVPATDGVSLWLPATPGEHLPAAQALALLRLQALRMAMRAERGSPALAPREPLLRGCHLLLEALAADAALAARLPGVRKALQALRESALQARPPLAQFPAAARPFEQHVRGLLQATASGGNGSSAREVLAQAQTLSRTLARTLTHTPALTLAPTLPATRQGARLPAWLWRDAWTGDWRNPPPERVLLPHDGAGAEADPNAPPPRSARLARQPQVREALEDENKAQPPGAWMLQLDQPHETAEDPMGLQRPTDRDETTATEEFADALSELPQARLVSTPAKPREVLLSDDPPQARSKRETEAPAAAPQSFRYPEWDWRAGAYRHPGATVWLRPAVEGPERWVKDTLAQQAGMLQEVRRRFEMLRAQRVRLRGQVEGDTVDVDAWCEAQADYRAGLPLSQRFYLNERRARRDLAITLLVDVSGSTDGWIAGNRRVIDVAREALLLVCIALEGLGERYAVLAFSGEGPQGVVVYPLKDSAEAYSSTVARRIAGLEPQHYTRAGAALRHATAGLMHEPAEHRLLLLLSDGKPNDVDDYEGRYGLEDMRQAVTEARLQGISPFCMTIDRQAANYLPAVFGPHGYAMLEQPQRLPAALLDWLRRLVVS